MGHGSPSHRVLRLQGPLAWPAWLLVCLEPSTGNQVLGAPCLPHLATTQEPRTTASLEAPRAPEEEGGTLGEENLRVSEAGRAGSEASPQLDCAALLDHETTAFCKPRAAGNLRVCPFEPHSFFVCFNHLEVKPHEPLFLRIQSYWDRPWLGSVMS